MRVGRVRCVSFSVDRHWRFGRARFTTATHYDFGPLHISIDRLPKPWSGALIPNGDASTFPGNY